MPAWQFSVRRAVPPYFRAIPADLLPQFSKPVFSTTSTPLWFPGCATTYASKSSRAAPASKPGGVQEALYAPRPRLTSLLRQLPAPLVFGHTKQPREEAPRPGAHPGTPEPRREPSE